ncbi:MAG: NAD-dependent epimerase/dehydratase family protein [Acidobacteriia bacterium]|nr:NAD-dependent epimerase/dehydratase family protein [Terriglobia bacterium]
MLLITGGTGFIGGHLVERLAAAGEPARCFIRRKTLPAWWPPEMEPAFGDLASGDGLKDALRGVDAVIHLAGTTKALRPADYHAGNVRAAETLARALADRPVRLVHVSSLAAAGPGAFVTEEMEPRPVSHYGRSKLEGERIVRAIAPEAVIVRPPVVYGPRDTDVFQVLKSVARGFALEIAGGERWFSAIYVKDLVEGLLEAVRSPRAAGRTYFLAHPKRVTWGELAATAARIMGRRPPRAVRAPLALAYAAGCCAEAWSRLSGRPNIMSRDKVREARSRDWTCDAGRAAAELGFEAHTGLEAGLAETLAWYKEAGWLRY